MVTGISLQIFFNYLLYARHYPRDWGYSGKPTELNVLFFLSFHSKREGSEERQQTNKYTEYVHRAIECFGKTVGKEDRQCGGEAAISFRVAKESFSENSV